MLKRLIGIFVVTVLLTFQFVVGSATAVELDEASRTVALNEK
ncbi:cytochrome c-550, partial [Fischerella thermalis WC542]